MEDQEAEVLLQVQRASVDEITQPANAPPSVGTRRTVVHGVELLVLAITFTPEQLQEAAHHLAVPVEQLSAAPGEPIVVIVCGEYRVPLLPSLVARRGSALNYVFYVPNLPIGINLDASTPTEVSEAFEFIVKTYGKLEPGAIPTLAAPTPVYPLGPQGNAPSAAAAIEGEHQPRDAPIESGKAMGQDAGGYYYQPPPPPLGGGYYNAGGSPAASPMASSGGSLEDQQRAALDAARNQTMYAPPRRLPGQNTLVMQTVPDAQPVRTATRIAHGIGSFARRATGIISGGGDLAARGVRSGAQHVVENTEATQNPVQVPAAARGHLRRTRMVSRGAVAITGGFAATIVGVTSVISDQVSSRLRPHVPAASQERSGLDDVKEVGMAAVGAAALVTDAAMEAARSLLSAGCDGASAIITHKLGEEAGETARDGLGLAQDAVASAANMRSAGLKSLAKVTLKDTAKKTVA